VGQSEPPSSLRRCSPAPFLIGRNGRGNWVVRDQSGRRGGLFVDRTSALRFALFENGHRPQAVVMVPGVLELDPDGSVVAAPRPTFADAMDRKVA
jgi:hypothetical protein